MGRRSVLTYLHHWTALEGVRSSVLAHNFYSVLANYGGSARIRARFYDQTGCVLRTDEGVIGPGREWTAEAPAEGEGAVEVDMPVPAWFPTEPGRAAARFYMLYRSETGMCGVVHCIEEAWRPGWLRFRWPHTHRPWESKRTIGGRGLRRIRVVGINHAPWPAHQHWVVKGLRSGYSENVQGVVPSRGLLALEFQPPVEDDWIVKSGCLSTKNGKPYVWCWYQEAPPWVHHG